MINGAVEKWPVSSSMYGVSKTIKVSPSSLSIRADSSSSKAERRKVFDMPVSFEILFKTSTVGSSIWIHDPLSSSISSSKEYSFEISDLSSSWNIY